MDRLPRDYAPALNESPDGWTKAVGLRYLRATAEEVAAELQVAERHLKADGTVDEALYGGLVEAVASVGGALHAARWGRPVVGLENQTSFLRTTLPGTLRVTAKPLLRDRDTQIWEAQVTDQQGQVIASGRLRLICLEEGTPLTTPVIRLPRL
jgi:1,4-dihydroxy-2-naphthoyl-CoA hydrolase